MRREEPLTRAVRQISQPKWTSTLTGSMLLVSCRTRSHPFANYGPTADAHTKNWLREAATVQPWAASRIPALVSTPARTATMPTAVSEAARIVLSTRARVSLVMTSMIERLLQNNQSHIAFLTEKHNSGFRGS